MYNNIIPQKLFAEKVYLAIKGLGTDNDLLNRVHNKEMKLIWRKLENFIKKNIKFL